MENRSQTNANYFSPRISLIFRILLFTTLFGLFAVSRGMGLNQPYHQDEYKWALIVNDTSSSTSAIPHPPLVSGIYHYGGLIVGYDHLRVFPVLGSFILLVALFFLTKKLYGRKPAIIISFLYVLNLYSTVASLQIDIDGVFLPLFSFLTLGGYLWLIESPPGARHWPITIFIGAVVLGILTKLSFFLAPITVGFHYLVTRFFTHKSKKVFSLVLPGTLVLNWGFLKYPSNFLGLSERSYSQLFFLSAKAFLLSSPSVILGLILGWKWRQKLFIWYLFIFFNILFYTVFFDFTHRTLDRYWMFLIVPGVIILGYALSILFSGLTCHSLNKKTVWLLCLLVVIVMGFSWFSFIGNKLVLPLQPKSDFVSAVANGDWSFLIPFTSGSGPLGFYLPADTLIWLWIVSMIGLGFILFSYRKSFQWVGLTIFIVAIFSYNSLGMVEYLTGRFFGSTTQVYRELVSTLNRDSKVSNVTTYNDIAAYELMKAGKYKGRFFNNLAPVTGDLKKFADKGYFMILNFPEINKKLAYWKYLQTCRLIKHYQNIKIEGMIFYCLGGDLNKFQSP